MVTIDQTRKKYRGRKAETYDAIREKQARWGFENETVGQMLRALAPRSVLDVPVGTGRFFQAYYQMSVPCVLGVDVSEEMLALARRKIPRMMRRHAVVDLKIGNAAALDSSDATWDVIVCVRFLDLIDESAMRVVVGELCRVSHRAVILTIRWGENYVNKSNTATHDRNAFKRLVTRLGWKIEEAVPFRDAGWVIIRLSRR